jgi:hypothetical protein
VNDDSDPFQLLSGDACVFGLAALVLVWWLFSDIMLK